MSVSTVDAQATPDAALRMLWLELTGRCQLSCEHCYASSSPLGDHGSMTVSDWRRVIDQAAAAGVESVCIIGGEPILHPGFVELVKHAAHTGLLVEVYSNLYRISDVLWSLFGELGVRLATSYYSNTAEEHDAITTRPGSHSRTRAAIADAVRRGIPIRVGIVDLGDGQHVDEARAELVDLGVPPGAINSDRVRSLGRATTDMPDVGSLCGGCGDGRAAIGPDGQLWPCPMSRWLTGGDLRHATLDEALAGSEWRRAVAVIPRGREHQACNPHRCPPSYCPPQQCTPGDGCGPGRLTVVAGTPGS